MSDRQRFVKPIEDAVRRREEAIAAREAATEDLRRYCRAARDAGIPITWIAGEAGLSRQGVYDLLAERPSP
jgi:FAD/FMN-containing dehydrogenase